MWVSRFSSGLPGGCEQSGGGDVGRRKLTDETLLTVFSVAASPENGRGSSKSSLLLLVFVLLCFFLKLMHCEYPSIEFFFFFCESELRWSSDSVFGFLAFMKYLLLERCWL